MPTAVMTESSENTMSSSMICTSTLPNRAAPLETLMSASPSSLSWISWVLLASRNRPPTIRIRSRPDTGWLKTVNSGEVRRMIQASDSSSRMRMIMARARPIVRPFWRCSAGSLPARIEMKMMLSIPRTISRAVNVINAIHAWGSLSHSILLLLPTGPPANRRGTCPSAGHSW